MTEDQLGTKYPMIQSPAFKLGPALKLELVKSKGYQAQKIEKHGCPAFNRTKMA